MSATSTSSSSRADINMVSSSENRSRDDAIDRLAMEIWQRIKGMIAEEDLYRDLFADFPYDESPTGSFFRYPPRRVQWLQKWGFSYLASHKLAVSGVDPLSLFFARKSDLRSIKGISTGGVQEIEAWRERVRTDPLRRIKQVISQSAR